MKIKFPLVDKKNRHGILWEKLVHAIFCCWSLIIARKVQFPNIPVYAESKYNCSFRGIFFPNNLHLDHLGCPKASDIDHLWNNSCTNGRSFCKFDHSACEENNSIYDWFFSYDQNFYNESISCRNEKQTQPPFISVPELESLHFWIIWPVNEQWASDQTCQRLQASGTSWTSKKKCKSVDLTSILVSSNQLQFSRVFFIFFAGTQCQTNASRTCLWYGTLICRTCLRGPLARFIFTRLTTQSLQNRLQDLFQLVKPLSSASFNGYVFYTPVTN